MSAFIKDSGKYSNIINSYKKPFEKYKISKAYEHDGKLYRQIVYLKTFTKNISGILIITDYDMVLKDERIISKLIKPFYYMDTLLDDEYREKLKKTILTDKQKEKEIKDNKKIIFALDALKRDNMNGIDLVKEIVNKLPSNKFYNNNYTLKFIDKANEYDKGDIIFNDGIINDLLLAHRDTLIKNLQRVKLINGGRDYYDDIKSHISGRNKFKMRSKGRDFVLCSQNLDYTMGYFRNILTLYDKILNMSEDDYIKYLDKVDNEKIEYRKEIIRG